MSSIKVPSDLVEQLLAGNCLLFLGNGYDLIGGDHSSRELLLRKFPDYVNTIDTKENLAKFFQFHEMQTDRRSLVERISNWIENNKQTPLEIDKIITRLPFTNVLTTRMDLSLESEYRNLNKSFTTVVSDHEVSFDDKNKVILTKVGGSIDQKGSLILTERDYLDFQRKRVLLVDYIRMLFATKTVLFVDFDLDDFYNKQFYGQIVRDVNEFTRKRYAIWKQADDYFIKYWESENVKVIRNESVLFFKALENEYLQRKKKHTIIQSPEKQQWHRIPYKYLDSFEAEDTEIFFGRDSEISVLSKRIMAYRVFVLFGSSGVGKTSLIKAGLMSEIEKYNSFSIYTRVLDSPINSLSNSIINAIENESSVSIETNETTDSDNKLFNLFIKAQQIVGKKIILFIDQFEEFFHLDYEDQCRLLEQLEVCINEDKKLDCRIVFCIRDDYLKELESLQKSIPYIYRNIIRLKNFTDRKASEAIVKPLDDTDIKYEEKLVTQLLDDLKSSGSIAPAQLQIVCSHLYENFSKNQIITIEDYNQTGAVAGILKNYLGEVLDRFNYNDKIIAKEILKALVGSEETKKLLSAKSLSNTLKLDWMKIEKLVAELDVFRLLRRLETKDGYKYELVHDYIVNEVWKWMTDEDVRVKEIQDLIDYETKNWSKYQALISSEKLNAIYNCWEKLLLEDSHLTLLFRSSVKSNLLGRWNALAESFGNKISDFYLELLSDNDANVINVSMAALIQMGEKERVNQRLLNGQILNTHQEHLVRRALEQNELGRSSKDLENEGIDFDSWKEKSVWNTSSIVGIDFGTTTSAISVFRNGKPVIIPNKEGQKFTPSVVAFTKDNQVVVGTPALLQAQTNPDQTIFSIKRKFGKNWQKTINGKMYSASEIASFIFQYLKGEAEDYLGREIKTAVVTVPAYFNRSQRNEVIKAAELGGFEVMRLVAEPTAASMAYGVDKKYDQTIAVYDLGGGTFDISILRCGEGVNEVKAINGNASIGGNDFDDRIINFMIEEFKKKHGVDLSEDIIVRIRLKEEAEKAKIALSGLDTYNIFIPYIYAIEDKILHLDLPITRKRFENLTEDLVEKIAECCKKALEASRYTFDDEDDKVDELILVGLSTKIPVLRNSASHIFNRNPLKAVDPDEAVALGAAVQASILSGSKIDFLLLDATPFSLGIEVGGKVEIIIPCNTTIPTRKSEIFSTAIDDQKSVVVKFFEGESESVENNTLLGFLELEIPPAPKGIPQIEITIQIDANFTLEVLVEDLGTRRSAKKVIASQIQQLENTDEVSRQVEKVKNSGLELIPEDE